MGKGGLPERWENYSNIGEVIKGTRFVPFKVPLNEHLLTKVPEGVDRNWGLEHLKESCPNLALIVDLTNTSRYYSGQHAQQMGVKYAKIMTPGHEVPGRAVVERFYHVVSEVLDTEGEGVVGVHCTHGLNRTGYLICRYMVEKLGVDPEEAISAFDDGRGHKQERNNYLEHLREKKWEKEKEKEPVDKGDRESGATSQEGMTYGQYKKMKLREDQNDTSSRDSQANQQSFSNPRSQQQQQSSHRQSQNSSWDNGGFGHNFTNMNIRGAPPRGIGGAWQGEWRGHHRGSWGGPSQQRDWRGGPYGRGGGSSFQGRGVGSHFNSCYNDSGYRDEGSNFNSRRGHTSYDSRNEGNVRFGRQADYRHREGQDGSTKGAERVEGRGDSRGQQLHGNAERKRPPNSSNAGFPSDSGNRGPQQSSTHAHDYATRKSLNGEEGQEQPPKEKKKPKKKHKKSDHNRPGENQRKRRKDFIQSEGGIFV